MSADKDRFGDVVFLGLGVAFGLVFDGLLGPLGLGFPLGPFGVDFALEPGLAAGLGFPLPPFGVAFALEPGLGVPFAPFGVDFGCESGQLRWPGAGFERTRDSGLLTPLGLGFPC